MTDWLERVESIAQSPLRSGICAPHEPLLLLTALANGQRTGSSEIDYRDFEPRFT